MILLVFTSCYSEWALRAAQRLSVQPINTCKVNNFNRMSNLWFMLPTTQPTRDTDPVAGT